MQASLLLDAGLDDGLVADQYHFTFLDIDVERAAIQRLGAQAEGAKKVSGAVGHGDGAHVATGHDLGADVRIAQGDAAFIGGGHAIHKNAIDSIWPQDQAVRDGLDGVDARGGRKLERSGLGWAGQRAEGEKQGGDHDSGC